MSLSMAVFGTDRVFSSIRLPVYCWYANSIETHKDGTIGLRYVHLSSIFVEVHFSWNWPGHDLKLEKEGCALLYHDGIFVWVIVGANGILPVDFKRWSLLKNKFVSFCPCFKSCINFSKRLINLR